MEYSADSGSSGSVPNHSEDSQQVDSIQFETKKTLDLHHSASSSPDLKIKPSLPALESASSNLSRSRTLPLRSPKRIPSIPPTLQGVTFEIENLERLRRWVLGLAIGNCCLLVQLYILCTYPFHFLVDFDHEQGPSLSCIFPLLPLYPFEAENMFVLLITLFFLIEVDLH